MILSANPTRMELLRLKKKIVLALRGHKLLKDKQDELVRHFLSFIKEWETLRSKVENELVGAFYSFFVAYLSIQKEILKESLAGSQMNLELSISRKRVANLQIPQVSVLKKGEPINYGFVNTIEELDRAIQKYAAATENIIRLAAIERSIVLLSIEIKKTRRRVNALEYVLIPNLRDTIKYISMKMGELERNRLTQLMRIKEIVRAH